MFDPLSESLLWTFDCSFSLDTAHILLDERAHEAPHCPNVSGSKLYFYRKSLFLHRKYPLPRNSIPKHPFPLEVQCAIHCATEPPLNIHFLSRFPLFTARERRLFSSSCAPSWLYAPLCLLLASCVSFVSLAKMYRTWLSTNLVRLVNVSDT